MACISTRVCSTAGAHMVGGGLTGASRSAPAWSSANPLAVRCAGVLRGRALFRPSSSSTTTTTTRQQSTAHNSCPARAVGVSSRSVVTNLSKSSSKAAARAFPGQDAPPLAAEPRVQHVDFMVIGSGIAGLSYALKVADYGSVAVVTKDFASEGCTQYAQGGVCAVLDQTDSVQNHVRDTLVAGAFLNDPK